MDSFHNQNNNHLLQQHEDEYIVALNILIHFFSWIKIKTLNWWFF